MSEKQKIEIELDPKMVKQLKIISKAFGKSINWLIEKNIKKDLKFMLYTNKEGFIELEHYFKTSIVDNEILKCISYIEDEVDTECKDTHYVPIEEGLSKKLYQISKITGIPVKEIVNNELGGLLSDHMRENPIVFLDSYLGIKNIKDPISMVKTLKPIIDIPDDYMKEIENTDPMFYINRYNPYKYK